MNKYEFYSKLLQEDFPVQYRQDFAEHDSEQCKKIRDLKAQLAEAVGLLRNVDAEVWPTWGDSGSQAAALHEVKCFLARHAQPEQVEGYASRKEAEASGICQRPPEGWVCSRKPGHNGPCAASVSAPPAAAHGDEAVRKPELVGYFSFCEDKQKWLQQKSKGAEFNHLFTALYVMRAQAGEGGE